MKTETKRRLLYLAAAMLTAGSIPNTRADYASEVLALQPLTYWRLNEAVTVPTYDYSATNRGSLGAVGDGRYYDGVTRPVAGAIAGDDAVAFSNPTLGTAYFGSMRVSNNPALNPSGPFTVEFWAKPSNNTAALLSPVNSMSFTTGRAGYLFYQNGATWQFRIGVTTSTTASLINGGTIVTNQWQHVVGVYSGGASGTMTLFVDGVQVASGPASYEVNDNAAFFVGSTSSPSRTFDGSVDEVAFYSGILSAGQIAAHFGARTTNTAGYAAQILSDAPVGYWQLNEPLRTYPAASNAGSLGTAANGAYLAATNAAGPSGPDFPGLGVNNNCVALNGTDSGVRVLPGLGLSGPLTIVAWVNPTDLVGDQAIAGESGSYAFKLSGDGLRFTTPGILDHNGNVGSVTAGVWQQVAVTFRPGATDGAQFYVNGLAAGFATASALTRASNTFQIGQNQWAGQEFGGAIDEVAVYDKILSAGNLLSLYFTAIGSNAAPFMVSDPPVINPVGTIYTTTPFSLTADVAGSLPMGFQWRKDGVNLPGATLSAYAKASAATNDAGNYDLVATNSFGAVTSLVVSVTIDPAVPPTITGQPGSQQVYPGGTASFTVLAGGTMPLSYQWRHAGTNLPGATSGRLMLTNCTVAETGTYTVNVTNVAGARLSAAATLTLRTPAAGSYEEKVAATQPVAYWRLGETSGTTAYDYAGGNHGTNSAEIALSAAGPAAPLFPGLPADNTGYTFNAGDSYVETASLGLAGPISVSAWIKPNALVGDRAIVGENVSWSFKLNGSALRFTTPGILDHNSAGVVQEGVWQHVAVSFLPGAAGGARFYLNGVSVGAVTASALTRGSSSVWIGKSQWAGQVFNGDMDEIAVYNRVLSDLEICELYMKATGNTNKLDPTIALISGTGTGPLTNVNFTTGDGGFVAFTPVPTGETDWAYSGTAWWSPGQAATLSGNNITYLTNGTPYVVTKAGVVSLSFTHRHSFEVDWDGGGVQVSINGGPFATVPQSAFTANGYNGTLVGNTGTTLAGQRVFFGNSAGHPAYVTSTCLLAGVQAGDTVVVQFVANYDGNTTGSGTPTGWEITQVQLTQGGGDAARVACPCGVLQRKVGSLEVPWVDLGVTSTLISTTATNQQYFRVRQ